MVAQTQAHPPHVTEVKEKIDFILDKMKDSFPEKAVVTAGMPYANGPVHIGHLAGTHVPADIYSRFLKLLIGNENVLFVCGTDDHGSTSEVAAKKVGKSTREFIDEIHSRQAQTMKSYGIDLDVYTGTSREENYETHKEICQDFLRDLYKNERLDKRTSLQWFDEKASMFLPDRYVTGTCPKCEAPGAYSEECDSCGANYEAKELKEPISSVTQTTPELKETDHWYLNMWKATDQLCEWLEGNQKTWRKNLLTEVLGTVRPTFIFSNTHEDSYKEIKEDLPEHKSRYAPGKKVALTFKCLNDLEKASQELKARGFDIELLDAWAHRSITRDVSWAIPVPEEIDETMKGKTLYVWPESLIAPISFSKLALKNKGKDPQDSDLYWKNPKAGRYQFLGQDNIFFYVLMQGSMWLGTQKDPKRLPVAGEYQMTDIFSNYHLQINGAKMSKSKGNFFTGDQLIAPKEDGGMGYHPDQIRYFLSILSLTEKNSNFDEEILKERNKFLAGPLNAAFEKPISACHSKFKGQIPEGDLIGKTAKETQKIIPNYIKMMKKGDYAKILFAIENYARVINGLFSVYKPHDDRGDDKERADALYSCFYILKNVMIMLSPFAPVTMEKLRISLNLPEESLSLKELGVPLMAGHTIHEQSDYFPAVSE